MDSSSRILSPAQIDSSAYRCKHLVVGTGAGGAVAGTLLAEAGEEVLFLEDGLLHRSEDYTENIGEMTAALYRDGGISPLLGMPPVGFAEGRCVGGGTVINGGLIWRTPPWILEEWSRQYGLSGYDQDALIPHFESIERDLNVVIREPENDANLDSMVLRAGADQLGWKHVMIPHAVKDCTNRNLCPTGCPTGAKQSMLESYLPRALDRGARIITGSRALRIRHEGGRASSVVAKVQGRRRPLEIHFDELTVAGGAVQTPHLLSRSGLGPFGGHPLQFHLNLKVLARFKDEVRARQGAMFTVQVQEYEREGMLFMGSNLQPHYVAMTLSQYGPPVIDRVLDAYDHLGLYVAMIRARSQGRILSWTGDRPTMVYRFHPEDLEQAKSALRRACTLLFASGAEELFLPIRSGGCIHELGELEQRLDGLSARELELITVHVMASCPMGSNPRRSRVDLDGRLRGMQNLWLADASILPSNIGESPQGTIMAFVRETTLRRVDKGLKQGAAKG